MISSESSAKKPNCPDSRGITVISRSPIQRTRFSNFARLVLYSSTCGVPSLTSLLMGPMYWDDRLYLKVNPYRKYKMFNLWRSFWNGSCQYWAWTRVLCTLSTYAMSNKSLRTSQKSNDSTGQPGKPNTPWCWPSIETENWISKILNFSPLLT